MSERREGRTKKGPVTYDEARPDVQRLVDIFVKHGEGERSSMDDFIRVYGREEVERDKDSVEKIRGSFEQVVSEAAFGQILHHSLVAIANRFQWFGRGSEVINTLPYDDYVNGTDFVIDFGGGVRLGIDVIYSNSDEVVREKLERNQNMGQKGALIEVKYFKSRGHRGRINVPKVVIGGDEFYLRRYFRELLQSGGATENFKHNYMRVTILLEIQGQLRKILAEQVKKRVNPQIIQIYLQVRQKIDDLLRQKENVLSLAQIRTREGHLESYIINRLCFNLPP